MQPYGKALKVYSTWTVLFRLYLTLNWLYLDIQHKPDCISWQMSPHACNSSIFLSISLVRASCIVCISSAELHACYTDIEINRMDVETCMYNTRPLDWQNWYLCKIFLLVLLMLIILWIICTHIFEKCSKSKSDRTLIFHYWSQFSIIINI